MCIQWHYLHIFRGSGRWWWWWLQMGSGPPPVPMHLGLNNRPFVPHINSWEPSCFAKVPDGPQTYTLNVLWLQEKWNPDMRVWMRPKLDTHKECGPSSLPLLHTIYTVDCPAAPVCYVLLCFFTTHCSLRLTVRSELDDPTFATRRLHARAPSSRRWNCGQEMSGNFA